MSIWSTVKQYKDLATHPGLGDPDWPPTDFDGDGRDDLVYLGSAARDKLFGPLEWEEVDGKVVCTNDWKKNLVTIQVPQLSGVECYGRPFSGKVTVHRLIVPQFLAFWAAVEREGLLHLVKSWGGTYVLRKIRRREALSNHAYAVAFDMNMKENGLGVVPALVGREGEVRRLVPLAMAYGFFWGGHYRNRKDGMHFEAVKVLTPAELEELETV